jgi:hypothetical protein
VGVVVPVDKVRLVGEPKSDLGVCGLDSVGTVDNVTSNINAEVTADSSGFGVLGLGGTEHLAASLDGVVTFPDHAADGAGDHVLDKSGEELLGGKIGVVLFHVFLGGLGELHGDELESLGLETRKDGANESTLDTVGLDHNVGTFLLGSLHIE